MKACSNCNAGVFPEDLYCGQCGFRLNKDQISPYMTQTEVRMEDVRTKLGRVYYKMGKYKKAATEFKKAIKANPGDTLALKMLEQLKQEHNIK